MIETGRFITRNSQIEATPRRENGYRTIVEETGPGLNAYGNGLLKRYHQSPLLKSLDEAERWVPAADKGATHE